MKNRNKIMPAALAFLAFSTLDTQLSTAFAQGTAFTYQGRVTDSGTNFNGVGQFEFALVTSTNISSQATGTANAPSGGFITVINVTYGGNGYSTPPAVTITGGGGSGATATAAINGSGAVTSLTVNNPGSGYTSVPTVTLSAPPPDISYTTYWNNDESATSGEPFTSVSVPVTNGLFTVVLGDATQSNMTAIPAALFASQPSLQLRIWFSDGVSGFAALSPLQNLTPTPYADYATMASNVSGTITASQLPANVVINTAAGPGAIISGGSGNTASGIDDSIGGGIYNSDSGNHSTIGGGYSNTNTALNGTIGGGNGNLVSGNYANVGGGEYNQATGIGSFVGAGFQNTASAHWATTVGGDLNTASGIESVVVGGGGNTASGQDSTVSGGADNSATGTGSVVGGGGYDGSSTIGNYATGAASTVGGGLYNQATNSYATVPGGSYNVAGGKNSFAAGQQAQATNQGAFVWADSQNAAFTSTNNDSFNVRAQGGVRLVTSGTGLTVDGGITATAFSGNGAGLTNLTAAQLTTGTVPSARIGGTYSSAVNFTNALNSFVGSMQVGGTGTIFNQVEAGQTSVPTSSTTETNFLITYPKPFTAQPKVMATIVFSIQGVNDVYAINVSSNSTTAFRVNVMRLDSPGGWGQNLLINWMAWQ